VLAAGELLEDQVVTGQIEQGVNGAVISFEALAHCFGGAR
jgi:hypothetical protein